MPEPPLVACIHHPASISADAFTALRDRLAGAARRIEVRHVPFKESLAVRRVRSTGSPESRDEAPTAPVDFPAAAREAWRHSEAVLALDLPPEAVALAPQLRFVQAYSAGIEHFDRALFAERDIELATAAGVGAGPISEFAIARILEVFKNTRAIERMQRERDFHRPGGRSLAGSVMCLVGLGAIGRAVAERARALGVRVIATRRRIDGTDSGADCVDELQLANRLPQLLPQADIVVLAAALNDSTRGLIDAAALASMRPGTVLCNVARGGLIDEPALIAALQRGSIGAAILDVTEREPLPADDPLWDAPTLYLSPHCAVSPDAYDERMLDLFAENLERLARGELPRNRVLSELG